MLMHVPTSLIDKLLFNWTGFVVVQVLDPRPMEWFQYVLYWTIGNGAQLNLDWTLLGPMQYFQIEVIGSQFTPKLKMYENLVQWAKFVENWSKN